MLDARKGFPSLRRPIALEVIGPVCALMYQLKNTNEHMIKPDIQTSPGEQPTPVEQPAPAERPRRRTFEQPVFTGKAKRRGAKGATTMLLLLSLFSAQAQTHPVPDPPTNPGSPTMPADQQDHRLQQRDPQQPGTKQTRTNDGWIMFDERNTMDLDLQEDQLQRLRDVDGRYQKEYAAFGTAPSKNPGYRTLTEKRNADVRGILTPDQYARWERMRTGTRGKTPTEVAPEPSTKPTKPTNPSTP